MLSEDRVPAVGDGRPIPAPDPFARDYLLLALRLDRLLPGLVDAYFGPASLKEQVALEPPARETQSSVNFAVGTVPDVMRQSLSGAATFRMTIVPNDRSVPITSAPAVTAT